MSKPIIGRYYYANPTLRKMPPGWVLSGTLPDARRFHWWQDGDSWIGLFCIAVGIVACLVVVAESV